MKPLNRQEIAQLHQKRPFFVIHTNTPTGGNGRYRVDTIQAGWADCLLTIAPDASIAAISLVGLGDFPQPWTDGTITLGGNKFLHIFNRKIEGLAWAADEHGAGPTMRERLRRFFTGRR